jgi:hypothetical protein
LESDLRHPLTLVNLLLILLWRAACWGLDFIFKNLSI